METEGMGLFGIARGEEDEQMGGMGQGGTGQERAGQVRNPPRSTHHPPPRPSPPRPIPHHSPTPLNQPADATPSHSTLWNPTQPHPTHPTHGFHQSSPHHSHPASPHPIVALPNVREGQAIAARIRRQKGELREFIQAVVHPDSRDQVQDRHKRAVASNEYIHDQAAHQARPKDPQVREHQRGLGSPKEGG